MVELLGLPLRCLAIVDEARAQHVLRLVQLVRRDAVGADRIELQTPEAVQPISGDPLIDDAVGCEAPGPVARAVGLPDPTRPPPPLVARPDRHASPPPPPPAQEAV